MADKVQHYTLGERIGTGGTGTVRRARFTGEREQEREKSAPDSKKQDVKKQDVKKQPEKISAKEKLAKEKLAKEKSALERMTAPKGEIAIKTLQPDIARDPVTRKRLLASRKQLQSVQPQENLARVLDIVEQGDTLHILMEYAPGKSLESSLGRKSRPMPQETAVQILNQVLRAAVAAHSKGVLHGNLKPSDVLFQQSLSQQSGAELSVKVSGFGLAQHFSNTALLRAAGRTHTLPYLAPEQVRGEIADERTDVYSAGMMLYRMLTGKLPYTSTERGAEVRIRHAILNEPLPDIAQFLPEGNVSPQLQAIVRRALAKDRRERIPTMRDFSRLVQKLHGEFPTVPSQAITATTTQQQDSSSSLSSRAAVVGALAGTPALASAVLQFPPPSTPIEQQVSLMEPVRSFTPSEQTLSAPSTSSGEASTAGATAAAASQAPSAPSVAENPSTTAAGAKEKSLWNILTNPGDITTPAATGAPTLVKSAAELEVERRMQALRAHTSSAEGSTATMASALPASAFSSTFSPAAAQDSSLQESNIQQTVPRPIASSIPAPVAAAASAQAPLYAPEEKKKRSVVPWLVVGALALGGGVYYVALKNKIPLGAGLAKGLGSSSQQALSKEELERQYDSLSQVAPPTSSSNTGTADAADNSTPESSTASNTSNDEALPAISGTVAQEKPASTALSQETKETKEQAAPRASTPAPKPAQAEKTSSVKSALTDAPKASAAKSSSSKDAPNIVSEKQTAQQPSKQQVSNQRSQSASLPEKPASTLSSRGNDKKRSDAPSDVPSSVSSSPTLPEERRPAPRRTEKRAEKRTEKRTEKTPTLASSPTSTDAANNTADTKERAKKVSKKMTKDSSSQASSKSGSLAAYTAAQDAEREAARRKIKEKYATHLNKTKRTAEAQKLAVNDAKTEEKSGGKSIPTALKNLNAQNPPAQNSTAQGKTHGARTNREDNYTPAQNPVEVTNEIDSSTTVLESASRKAKGTEPYLILRGHVGTVRSVSFSPDGKLIVSGSEDKTVKIWDAATGTILRSLRGHGNSVTSVFFSPDSKFVISSSKDKTVRIWDAETGNTIQRSPGVSCEGSPAAFSPDGSLIATANNRNVNIAKVQK
ncbi:MAG: hypothetical protein EAZ92_07720 [Candidatus Kapaibacterium sp.]|nr:MAG: hypothetical protein EAZ92_07720 [Candidatus Kapabacteria bacterium]